MAASCRGSCAVDEDCCTDEQATANSVVFDHTANRDEHRFGHGPHGHGHKSAQQHALVHEQSAVRAVQLPAGPNESQYLAGCDGIGYAQSVIQVPPVPPSRSRASIIPAKPVIAFMPQPSVRVLIIQLGRFGDIANILPACKHLAETNGKVGMLVAKEFASILDGVSYVEPVLWSGQYGQLTSAYRWARPRWPEVLCSQAYDAEGRTDFGRQCHSFNMESWRQIGLDGHWGKFPLVFDRRDKTRESVLVAPYLSQKPMLLLNLAGGHSGPFADWQVWQNEITGRWGDKYNIVDLARIQAARIYDLIGFMDRAEWLVTADTATLHLATASKVKLISLQRDGWEGALPSSPRSILHMPYSQAAQRLPEVHALLSDEVGRPKIDAASMATLSLLAFNRCDLTKTCLESLRQHTPKRTRLLVSDNASTDGTREWLKKQPDIEVIQNESNLGFGVAHNKAFERCETDYFVVLNNDIVVCEGWLEKLLAPMLYNPKCAQVGLDNTCTQISHDFEGKGGPPHEYCEGSFMSVRVSAVKELQEGLFSPYVKFIYGEDSDLSLRLREHGWSLAHIWLPIFHAHSSTIKTVAPEVAAHIAKCKAENHEYLKNRWQFYLKTRRFDYRVLVKRKHARGDVLMASAAVAAIKRRWPSSVIDVQTDFGEIFANNPDVACTLQDAGNCEYDFTFTLDLAYEGQRKRHVMDCYADAIGTPIIDRRPRLYPTSGHHENAELWMPEGRWLVIHPGMTTWPGKNWLPSRFREVVNAARAMGWKTCIVGDSATPRIQKADLHLAGQIGILELAAVMERAKLFLGLDSFPAHAARAMRCPAIVLFGTTLPQYLFDQEDDFFPICADQSVPCAGEHHRDDDTRTFSACDGACMKSIQVEQVLEAIRKVT